MSRDVKVISIYCLKSVFNVFLGETPSWVPLNYHAGHQQLLILACILQLVEKSCLFAREGLKHKLRRVIYGDIETWQK